MPVPVAGERKHVFAAHDVFVAFLVMAERPAAETRQVLRRDVLDTGDIPVMVLLFHEPETLFQNRLPCVPEGRQIHKTAGAVFEKTAQGIMHKGPADRKQTTPDNDMGKGICRKRPAGL
jgi:hypothetical protein